MNKYLLIVFFQVFCCSILVNFSAKAATKTAAATGNWSAGATWGGSIPASGDIIIIASPFTVTLDVNIAVASVTINSGGIFNGGTGSNTLTVNAAGTITNNGTYTGNTETISFSGAGTINGSNAVAFNNVTINGATTLTTIPTFNGILQINASGNLSAAPNYGATSTLLYNGTYTRFNEWTTAISGAGYPANVQISNNSTFTFKPGGGGLGQCSGNLIIDAGSTLTMSNMTSKLIVTGDMTCNGTIQLGTGGAGGDLQVGGNLTRGAASTWTNNTRSVMFIGTGTQTVTYTGGGTWQFDYFSINKPSGNVLLSSSPATNVQLQQTAGNLLTINNAGGLDLNGQTMTLGCAGCMGGNILVDGIAGGTTKTITSTVAGGIFRIQGNASNSVGKIVTNSSNGTLVFSTNTILAINGCQLNPGANLTTVNSELDIESGGDNITNACTYGTSSILRFKNGSVFVLTATQKTWVSGASGVGVPYNVTVDGSAVAGSGIRSNISASYYARKDFTITGNGTVDLSTTGQPANSLYVAGNWTGSLTEIFTPNQNPVIFNGASAQTLTMTGGTETFYDIEIANTSGDLT
jgi:hypothetical protein